MRWSTVALVTVGLCLVLGAPGPAAAQVSAATGLDPTDLTELYSGLTPEDRIGQLFIVAFLGDDVGPDSDIARLIQVGRVGGVVLQASSGNIDNDAPGPGNSAGSSSVPAAVALLTRDLQALALDGGPGVPLFIAVDQEGDGGPLSHLREGYTALPSAMAIGATWDPANAAAVGAIVGQELAATGVNLLLGPVLDVLAEPRITQRGDIGVRSFGGDPYWVGRMGAAYIQGVHEGSRRRVATVAKHFPGHGASDRLPDTEVATISKSLEELRRVELPPFEMVTTGAVGSDDGVTDALMTSHIRYRGFQGNLRDTTPPISLDRVALQAVLQLPDSPLSAWRASGGMTVSDSLGVRAIRSYDDPSGEAFHHRDVARRALMAGNDVLVLAQFAPRNVWSLQRDNISDTLRYFAAEYRRDPAFARRVDDASFRVLRRKAALYSSWSMSDVAASPSGAASATGTLESAAVVRRIADEAVTLLRRPEPVAPQGNDRIVIVADPGSLSCLAERCGLPVQRWEHLGLLGPTLVGAIMVERFGDPGAGRIRGEAITSVSFCELARALRPSGLAVATDAAAPQDGSADEGRGECGSHDSAETIAALRNADWIVFAFTDLNPGAVANGDAVENFLRVAAGVLRPRTIRLAALSFGPPYPFEPTDFNKLDVFVAAYSKIPAAVEAAIDVLFGEGDAPGSSPVTVEGADYDLATALEPDPRGPVP
ncbi:MAG: glycoside hydrolase family 3 N-terminal domain-containing protein, partial [Anaerolineae bacterium]